VDSQLIVGASEAAKWVYERGFEAAVTAAIDFAGDVLSGVPGIGKLLSLSSGMLIKAAKWLLKKVAQITAESFGLFVGVHLE
jgi:hypothetical protein